MRALPDAAGVTFTEIAADPDGNIVAHAVQTYRIIGSSAAERCTQGGKIAGGISPWLRSDAGHLGEKAVGQ